ncbi:hypothetical protein PybrP1_006166 [[Pythium] brassicae (nom. inval.)]|nr:hypothetical protein PybrP1_006166 [[Pythium] brassicae (nom. inval.)]
MPPPTDTFRAGYGALPPTSPSRESRALFFASAEATLAPSTAPGGAAASDAIDENLLLAETEELLAALDATAFISSSTSTEDDGEEEEDESSCGSRSDSGAFPFAPQSSSAVATLARQKIVAPATIGKKRVRSRDRTKDELLELRRSVVDLEKHLVALRRNTAVVGKGKRNVLQTWEHIARRQLRGRERAEQENQHLKAMLLGQLSLAGRFDHSSNKRQLVAFPDLPSTRQQQDTRAYVPLSASSIAVMEAMIGGVDATYEQMDAVFRENEMDQWRQEPKAYAQTKSGVSPATGEVASYLELVEMRLIPFHVTAVGDYMWQSMRNWHERNSLYSYPCTDRPGDTFAVSYRVQSRLGPTQEKFSAAYKLVKRRYVRSDNEVVVVWKSRSDGDNALAGFCTDEVGWVVVSAVPSIDASTPPMTALRACVHICPQRTGDGGSDGAAASESDDGARSSYSLLTDLVVGNFEDDVNSINQAMEDMLLNDHLRQAGRSSAASAAASGDRCPQGRIHYAALMSEEEK